MRLEVWAELDPRAEGVAPIRKFGLGCLCDFKRVRRSKRTNTAIKQGKVQLANTTPGPTQVRSAVRNSTTIKKKQIGGKHLELGSIIFGTNGEVPARRSKV